MPKGEYYIGDLCYVLDDVWGEVCSNLEEGEHVLSDGRKYALYFTKYGDGLYSSNIGTIHPVDAGLIGAIKLEDIGAYRDGLGATVEFKHDFNTSSDDGVIVFGHVKIDTADSNDDFDDDFYDDEDIAED